MSICPVQDETASPAERLKIAASRRRVSLHHSLGLEVGNRVAEDLAHPSHLAHGKERVHLGQVEGCGHHGLAVARLEGRHLRADLAHDGVHVVPVGRCVHDRTSFCPALGGGAGHANVPPRRLRLLESRHVHRGTVPHVDERHRVVAALAILRPLGHARHPIHRRVDRRLQHRAKHARRADRNVPHARVRERRLHQLLLPRLGAAIPVVLGLLRGVVAPVLLRLDGGLRLRRHRGHG
mmetsp:Transcript_30453/g.100376  ORF Transcript_30453/g.100376 Transcript_30453/m.100376 type:complete len:237 (+) Transcript_30453:161-871(+)